MIKGVDTWSPNDDKKNGRSIIACGIYAMFYVFYFMGYIIEKAIDNDIIIE